MIDCLDGKVSAAGFYELSEPYSRRCFLVTFLLNTWSCSLRQESGYCTGIQAQILGCRIHNDISLVIRWHIAFYSNVGFMFSYSRCLNYFFNITQKWLAACDGHGVVVPILSSLQ